MSISTNNTLILRKASELLLWDSKTVHRQGMETTVKKIGQQMMKNAIGYAERFGKDISHIPKEMIFEAYISKYYNIRECEKFLFGFGEGVPKTIG